MNAPRKPLPPALTRSTEWTVERISALSLPEVKQLRENAERLQEPEIAERCTQVIKARPRTATASKTPKAKAVKA